MNGIDPSGLIGNFSIGSLSLTMAIGATIAGGFNAGVNFATGNKLTENLVWAMLFGAVAGPLALLAPMLGLGVAVIGLAMTANMAANVWLNPKSSWQQKGVSVLLVAAAAFGVFMAGANAAKHGWINLKAFSTQSKVVSLPKQGTSLNRNSTLSELLPGVADDAFIHLSPAEEAALSSGVKSTYWARFGDVKNLTLMQYKNGVVGTGAPGNSPNATTFAISYSDPLAFTIKPSCNLLNIVEYYNNWTVKADGFAIVTPTN